MRVLRFFVLLGQIVVCLSASASGPKVHRFAGGADSRFANAYWFRTERGSVLVDAPFLAQEAAALGSEMAAAGALPLGAAILTSPRAERSWGLTGLLSRDTRVWGTRTTATALEAGFTGERERLLRAGIPLASMPRRPPLVTNAFSGSLNLGYEGYTLRLLEVAENGAPPTMVAFVPETGELFAGGLASNGVHPLTAGADLGAWRRTLSTLKRLGPRLVYPGSGDPGTVELLDRMSAYLASVEEAVRPFAARSTLSARDLASLRRGIVRRYRGWLLPSGLDASLRAEHARLRGLLAGGD